MSQQSASVQSVWQIYRAATSALFDASTGIGRDTAIAGNINPITAFRRETIKGLMTCMLSHLVHACIQMQGPKSTDNVINATG